MMKLLRPLSPSVTRLGLVLVAGLFIGAAPNTQYVVGNAVVTDRDTGLMWEQSTPVPPQQVSYADAASRCAGLTLNGLAGWRLPTAPELLSLVDRTGQSSPAIDLQAFTAVGEEHWTSTVCTGCAANNVYVVHFGSGYMGVKDKSSSATAMVRCVREAP